MTLTEAKNAVRLGLPIPDVKLAIEAQQAVLIEDGYSIQELTEQSRVKAQVVASNGILLMESKTKTTPKEPAMTGHERMQALLAADTRRDMTPTVGAVRQVSPAGPRQVSLSEAAEDMLDINPDAVMRDHLTAGATRLKATPPATKVKSLAEAQEENATRARFAEIRKSDPSITPTQLAYSLFNR